jgi:hypothetical protein
VFRRRLTLFAVNRNEEERAEVKPCETILSSVVALFIIAELSFSYYISRDPVLVPVLVQVRLNPFSGVRNIIL